MHTNLRLNDKSCQLSQNISIRHNYELELLLVFQSSGNIGLNYVTWKESWSHSSKGFFYPATICFFWFFIYEPHTTCTGFFYKIDLIPLNVEYDQSKYFSTLHIALRKFIECSFFFFFKLSISWIFVVDNLLLAQLFNCARKRGHV